MTFVNLNQNLLSMLNELISSASKITIHDTKLLNKVDELKKLIENPTHVDCDSLISTIMKLAEILKAYDIPDHIPQIIFDLERGLTELNTETLVKSKHFIVAKIIEKADKFFKLAIK